MATLKQNIITLGLNRRLVIKFKLFLPVERSKTEVSISFVLGRWLSGVGEALSLLLTFLPSPHIQWHHGSL